MAAGSAMRTGASAGADLEAGAFEEAARDRGAHVARERLDRVPLGEGDLGHERAPSPATHAAEQRASRARGGGTPARRRRREARARPRSSGGPATARPTTVVPSATAAATVAPSRIAARIRACPAAGSAGGNDARRAVTADPTSRHPTAARIVGTPSVGRHERPRRPRPPSRAGPTSRGPRATWSNRGTTSRRMSAAVSSERASADACDASSSSPAFGASSNDARAAAPARTARLRPPSARATPPGVVAGTSRCAPASQTRPMSVARPGTRRSRRHRSPASGRRRIGGQDRPPAGPPRPSRSSSRAGARAGPTRASRRRAATR